MKIALYTGTYVKNQDGVARATYHLVDSLLKEEIEILIGSPAISPQKHRKNLSFFKLPSIPLGFLPKYRLSMPNLQYFKELDKFRPDLIHIATPDILGILTCYYGRRRRIPVVIMHHSDFQSYLKYYNIDFFRQLMWYFMVKLYNNALRIYPPTDEYARLLSRKGVKSVGVWSRGINRQQFNPIFRSISQRRSWGVLGKKVIMFTGRFVWYKDMDIFIEVYKRFEKRIGKDVAFVLIGDGPIRSELEEAMPKAVFTGYLDGEKLSRAFACGDIFLFPSTTETFGQVIQESISSGLVPVVSDQGGCQEIVKKSKTGFIIPAKDVDAYYNACNKLIKNQKLFLKMRGKGLLYAQGRTWDKINGDLIEQYRYYSYIWHKKNLFRYFVPVKERINEVLVRRINERNPSFKH